MRILEILPEEENRVDLLLMCTMGTYSGRTLSLFYYFNPRINILSDITSGTKVWIPEEADISMITDYRGHYSLNGWSSD